MANALYPLWKQELLQGSSNTSLTGNVKALLVNTTGAGTTYTYSAAHQFLSDVASGARIATSGNLTTKTYVNGVFKAANAVFSSVSGDISEAIIIFIDTGVAATSRLVFYQDTGITGAPVTPNGGDIDLNFDSGSNGIFAL